MTDDRPLTVLVVDDDQVCRETIERLLGGCYALIEAATGPQALEAVASQDIDCVLLDYRLPQLDGLAVLPQLIESGVPVVMMTGEGNEQIAVEAIKQGAYDYLVKSTLTAVLVRTAIQKAIEHTALEDKVREQQEELAVFASVAAHDLRAPLRTIGAYIRFIQEDIQAADTEQVLGHCRKSLGGLKRMNELIEGMLEYTVSGRSDRAFEELDLTTVAGEVVAALESQVIHADARVDIGELPVVRGDRTALYQLLQNLVANALKFHDGKSAPCVRIDASREHDCWQVSVTDNGIGIEPRFRKTVFQSFKRLHGVDAYDGSGLGLATCKRIVDQHGGRIWLKSEPGEGSTFYFTIPIDPQAAASPSATGQASAA